MMSDKFFPEQHAPLSTQTMSATADHDTPMPDAPGEKDPRVELPPGHGEGVSNPKKRTLTRIIRNDPKKTDDSHQRSGTRELGGNIAKTFKTFGSRMSGGSSEEQYLEQKTPHKNEDESEDLRALRHSPSMQEQDRERSKKPEKELDHSLRNKGHELGEMSKGAEEYKIKWKKACQELSRLREQGQGYYQLADSDVTGLFSHLRKIIHDFAIQYFDGKSLNLSLTKESPNYLDLIQRQHTTKEDEYNSVNCEQRIQAIIWSIVETQVFNTYAWIGNETSKQFICLQNKLQPTKHVDSHGRWQLDPEKERKLHIWRANTIRLLLDSFDSKQKSDIQKDMKAKKDDCVTRITNTIGPILESEEQDVKDQLSEIINKVYELDKEICQQVACIRLDFSARGRNETCCVLLEKEELEGGNNTEEQEAHYVVVAPGVIKRGRSTGEEFKNEYRLLEVEIVE